MTSFELFKLLQFAKKYISYYISHTVIVDFGCGQYKQPGEGWAPSG